MMAYPGPIPGAIKPKRPMHESPIGTSGSTTESVSSALGLQPSAGAWRFYGLRQRRTPPPEICRTIRRSPVSLRALVGRVLRLMASKSDVPGYLLMPLIASASSVRLKPLHCEGSLPFNRKRSPLGLIAPACRPPPDRRVRWSLQAVWPAGLSGPAVRGRDPRAIRGRRC